MHVNSVLNWLTENTVRWDKHKKKSFRLFKDRNKYYKRKILYEKIWHMQSVQVARIYKRVGSWWWGEVLTKGRLSIATTIKTGWQRK